MLLLFTVLLYEAIRFWVRHWLTSLSHCTHATCHLSLQLVRVENPLAASHFLWVLGHCCILKGSHKSWRKYYLKCFASHCSHLEQKWKVKLFFSSKAVSEQRSNKTGGDITERAQSSPLQLNNKRLGMAHCSQHIIQTLFLCVRACVHMGACVCVCAWNELIVCCVDRGGRYTRAFSQ